MLALADIVVSRAGANAICELLALRKPSVLIPLSLAASRGDQILNAQSFDKRGYAKLLLEEDLTNESRLPQSMKCTKITIITSSNGTFHEVRRHHDDL